MTYGSTPRHLTQTEDVHHRFDVERRLPSSPVSKVVYREGESVVRSFGE